ncbi:unnamed protein product, partial [Nesidiocoris tenuis]
VKLLLSRPGAVNSPTTTTASKIASYSTAAVTGYGMTSAAIWTTSIGSASIVNVDCGPVESIEHGSLALTSSRTSYGAEAVFTCERNYTLVGDAKRVCGDGGLWSGKQPKCLFDWCPDPPQSDSTTVTLSGRNAGSTATYECKPGFILFGQKVDKKIRCPEPVLADHAILSVTGNDRAYGRTLIRTAESSPSVQTYKIGALAKYRCERGYKIQGDPLSTCEDNGRWSGDTPQCICKY